MKKIAALLLSCAVVCNLAACSMVDSASSGDSAGSSVQAEQDNLGSTSNEYFESLNADEINIQDTGIYVVKLRAQDGWQFDIADNTDVTGWLVNADGEPAIKNTSGVAFASNGEEEFTLNITIDASKITGFMENGSGEIYVLPAGNNPLVVEGDYHGQYTPASVLAGRYTIPQVQVVGTIEGEAGSEYIFTEDTVTIALVIDGLDDSLIDSSNASLFVLEGDGYYLDDYMFVPHELGSEWKNGEIAYTMSPEDLSFETGGWSPLGGDGNGNYYCNIGVDGLTYNGLPLAQVSFRVHVYSYGRTFSIESNGSLIDKTQPKWTTTAEDGIPVLCDAYPDVLQVTWPIDFDASALTAEDFTLALCSDYGDELMLEPGTDYTVVSEAGMSGITVNYIYWANIPVYTTLKVDVSTEHLTWDSEKYTVDKISYSYDIASVYAYYVMTGGMEGTQAWTYYGIDCLEDWTQVFAIPCYTLTCTAEDGTVYYYAETEDGTGILTTSADEAVRFDATEDCSAHIEGATGYFTRVYGQTSTKIINGQEYTFDKVYDNADNLPLNPSDCTGITARRGYILGSSWEEHARWPWQTFINTGYLGGTG